MSDQAKGGSRKHPGPVPETLKIELPWEEAVARALRKPIPRDGVPEREKRKQARARGSREP